MSQLRKDARRAEVRAVGRLGFTELGRATRGIAAVHRLVSDGVFSGFARTPLRAWTQPSHRAHDAVAGGVYTAVASSLEVAADIAGGLLDTPGRAPSATPRGAAMIGVLNGLIGDELEAAGSPLAPGMDVRVHGEPVAVSTDALVRAFPDPTGHLVVFLHGLMETEHAWRREARATYGRRLQSDLGATPIFVRYNTGRHISDNGRDLSELLNRLVLLWPTPVTTLTLVGHSMGGLVIRSACHAASESSAYWPEALRHTVSLGTPHHGAPLARGVHAATAALRSVPVTRPFGELLRRRSVGVRDLFHGNLIDDDWRWAEPDVLRQAPGADIPLAPGVRHLYATASVTRDPRHPLGRVIGDGLVLIPSGRGESRTRRTGFRVDDGLHVGGAHHFTLLNNESIYRWMRAQLAPRPQLPVGRTA
ncbi:GPI inositol-deacylase [Gordonia sp. ABSL49_1]|uniref:esterase/lipase family protein n=1 Tax=Gordonia sp. ABSL49_1 TaxID=2920941 RepID=UPI001F0D3185|nr:GPI inositol-deacylase [Gordonia sp. ABSL49_1]MCH5642762.1 GPI inositol-deacylase [Gordonia sp. ABSL49_1]